MNRFLKFFLLFLAIVFILLGVVFLSRTNLLKRNESSGFFYSIDTSNLFIEPDFKSNTIKLFGNNKEQVKFKIINQYTNDLDQLLRENFTKINDSIYSGRKCSTLNFFYSNLENREIVLLNKKLVNC